MSPRGVRQTNWGGAPEQDQVGTAVFRGARQEIMGGGGRTGPNFDRGVPLVNAKTHPALRETKGPDKPQFRVFQKIIFL